MSCALNCGKCGACLLSSQQSTASQQGLLNNQAQAQASQAQAALPNRAAQQCMGFTGTGIAYNLDPDYVNTRPYIDTDFSSILNPEFNDCQCVEKLIDVMDKLEAEFLKITAKKRPQIDKRFLKSFKNWKAFL